MIKKLFGVLILAGFIVSLGYASKPEGDKKAKNQVDKTLTDSYFTSIAVNNLEMYFSNTGVGSYNNIVGGAGMYFPKGTSKTCIFEDGPIIAGTVAGSLRVIGSTYNTCFTAGPILPSGAAANRADPKYKIYKINKNWSTWEDGPKKDQYAADSANWPMDDGAPWEYNKTGKRVPKFIGDEQAWFVMNDLDVGKVNSFFGTQPIGLEVQVLVWGYDLPGALGNTIFRKFTFINKGNSDLDSAYLAWWSDIDDGDGGDDLSGCDTALSLGYVYNGNPVDGTYGNLPPAVGFDYFQGPTVAGEATDEANWSFGKKKGYKNLKLTAFNFFDKGLPSIYADPPFTIQGGYETYNLMKGLMKSGQPWIDPNTGQASKFMFSGDPVAGTGWVDGPKNDPPFPPGDKRITLSSGPFQLMKKDTQELVVGTVVGQGIDRWSSITVLKFYDLSAQAAFDNQFQVPSPPPAPSVTVSELNNEIVLYWDQNKSAYTATESFSKGGYNFEGYNIYQLPTASGTKADAKLLATYDLANGITTILDKDLDMASGVVINKPTQFGKDNGIQRNYTATRDAITSRMLVNGQLYFFAVTSYCYNPDPMAIPAALENTLTPIVVRPQGPKPGYVQSSIPGTVLSVTKVGSSDGVVTPIVVDPKKTTGHTYKVTFDTVGKLEDDGSGTGDMIWNIYTEWIVTDQTTNKVVTRSTNQQMGDLTNQVFDGIFMTVTGPTKTGIRRDDDPDANGHRGFWFINDPTNNTTYGSGHRFTNPQNWTDLGFEAYGTGYANGLLSWGYAGSNGLFSNTSVGPGDLHRVQIWFNSDNTKWSKAYRYLRWATQPTAAGADPKYIINKTAGYPYQDMVDLPMQAWNMDVTPPQQLAVGFLENNAAFPNGECNGVWKPTSAQAASGYNADCHGREFLFIFQSPYSATPQPKQMIDILNGQSDMMFCGLFSRRTATRVFPQDAGASGIDVKMEMTVYYPNSKNVTFTFKAPDALTYNATNAQNDLNKVTVFPNPYYGFQTKEQNRFNRWVTFSHLPQKAKIKIYTLSGVLVRTLTKDNADQFLNWDLNNESRLAVASGMYIAQLELGNTELGDIGKKIIKIAIIQEAQILDRM